MTPGGSDKVVEVLSAGCREFTFADPDTHAESNGMVMIEMIASITIR